MQALLADFAVAKLLIFLQTMAISMLKLAFTPQKVVFTCIPTTFLYRSNYSLTICFFVTLHPQLHIMYQLITEKNQSPKLI